MASRRVWRHVPFGLPAILSACATVAGAAAGGGHASALDGRSTGSAARAFHHERPGQTSDVELAADLKRRIDVYQALHVRIEGSLPPLSVRADASSLETHQRAMAERIRDARRGARPGDIFTPAIQAWLKRRIAEGFKGLDREAILEALREEQEVEEREIVVELTINMPYPEGVGLASLPVAILRRLPALPEALEYRASDRRLILWDADANLVVDFMDDAL